MTVKLKRCRKSHDDDNMADVAVCPNLIHSIHVQTLLMFFNGRKVNFLFLFQVKYYNSPKNQLVATE